MNVRAATAQDAAGIVALHKGTNPFGDWYRNPFQRLGRVPYEDLTPFERWIHGGPWMDLSLFRRHLHEYQSRGFPVFVAEDRGRIVGECEVWLDEEPEPFGRYAGVEIVETGPPPNPDVERDLIARAADKVRKMGYAAIDLSPKHSGGESVAKDLGFRTLWDTREFTANLGDLVKPEEEFETRFLTGAYGDLRGMLALNHREPAQLRYEVLTARWPAVAVTGAQDATKLIEVAVELREVRFAVLASWREWLEPGVAEVDVWMEPADVRRPSRVRTAFSVGGELSRRLGAKRVTAYAPPTAAKPLSQLGFEGGDEPDAWLRWTF